MKKPEKKEVLDLTTSIKKVATKASKLEKEVAVLVVSNDQEAEGANEVLGRVKTAYNEAEKERKFFVDPLNAHVKEINAKYKEKTAPLLQAETIIKKALSAFQMKKIEQARKEEAKLLEKQEKKNAKLEAQGKSVDFMPAPQIEKPNTMIQTKSGKSVAKLVWKVEIKNVHDLPEEVKNQILDLAMEKGNAYTVVKRIVDSGVREMAGARIYEDVDISASGLK